MTFNFMFPKWLLENVISFFLHLHIKLSLQQLYRKKRYWNNLEINYEYDPLTSDNLGVFILNGISIILSFKNE